MAWVYTVVDLDVSSLSRNIGLVFWWMTKVHNVSVQVGHCDNEFDIGRQALVTFLSAYFLFPIETSVDRLFLYPAFYHCIKVVRPGGCFAADFRMFLVAKS